MWWWRALFILIPGLIVAGTVWIVRSAAKIDYRADDDLVIAVREEPDILNPFAANQGMTRNLTGLVFDRLLGRDDDMRLTGNVLESWQFVKRVQFFFTSEEATKAAAAELEKAQDKWEEWSLLSASRNNRSLWLLLGNHQADTPLQIVNLFPQEGRQPVHEIRVTTSSSIEESLANFREHATEAGVIERIRYQGDTGAILSVPADTERLLKELEIYYESNPGLKAQVEVAGEKTHLMAPEIILKLRKNIQWHDGQFLDAEDVIFSYRFATESSLNPLWRQRFSFVHAMEAEDAYTIEVECRDYYAPAMESFEHLPVVPSHLLENLQLREEWDAFFREPVGSGPYRMAGRETGRLVKLQANETYFRGAPRQQHLMFRVFNDDRERAVAARTGLIDVLLPDAAERRGLGPNSRFSEYQDVPRYETFIAWNLRRPLFQDVRVRLALAHAVDVGTLSVEVFGARATPWQGLFFPGVWYAPDTAEIPAFDPDRAANLLQDAGWTRDGGAWRDANGQLVTFSLLVDQSDELHRLLAENLAEEWRAAGLDVRVESMDWAGIMQERVSPGEFDAALLGWEMQPARDQLSIWHSTGVDAGTNFSGLRNSPVDSLLERLRDSYDEEETRRIASELQREIIGLQPCLFLCSIGDTWYYRTSTVRKSVPGDLGEWRTLPLGDRSSRLGVESELQWWVRSEEAKISRFQENEKP